jgi:hypothetical protein
MMHRPSVALRLLAFSKRGFVYAQMVGIELTGVAREVIKVLKDDPPPAPELCP